MRYLLVTVESVHSTGFGLQVSPTIKLKQLADRPKSELIPMQGDPLELRAPDGSSRSAVIGGFGIAGRMEGKHFITRSNPADPEFTLSIGGEVTEADVPPGTEVWLP